MADTCVKSIRVNTDEWDEARVICDGIHLPMSTAINLFIRQIVLRKGIPIELSLCTDEDTPAVLRGEGCKLLTDYCEEKEVVDENQEPVIDTPQILPIDEEIVDEVLEESTEVFEETADEVAVEELKPFDPVRHEQFKHFVENSELSERKPMRHEEPVRVDDFSDIFGGVFS